MPPSCGNSECSGGPLGGPWGVGETWQTNSFSSDVHACAHRPCARHPTPSAASFKHALSRQGRLSSGLAPPHKAARTGNARMHASPRAHTVRHHSINSPFISQSPAIHNGGHGSTRNTTHLKNSMRNNKLGHWITAPVLQGPASKQPTIQRHTHNSQTQWHQVAYERWPATIIGPHQHQNCTAYPACPAQALQPCPHSWWMLCNQRVLPKSHRHCQKAKCKTSH